MVPVKFLLVLSNYCLTLIKVKTNPLLTMSILSLKAYFDLSFTPFDLEFLPFYLRFEDSDV